MHKKKKKEKNMIDMSPRLNVKIIPGTTKESSDLQRELVDCKLII